MRPKCGRPLSADVKPVDVFSKQSKAKRKDFQSLNRLTADSKGFGPRSHTDVLSKMKRLKTRKERSQMRAAWRESSKTKPHHQHCRPHSSQDTVHFHNCCHSTCHCPSTRHTMFTSVVPATQEPSIITGRRLIGHHSLFNHEVKSVDIERLLSERTKVEKPMQQGKDLKKAISISIEGIGAVDTDVTGDWKVETALKTDDDQKREKSPRFSHEGSNISPLQRPQLDLSSGSANCMGSPKQSPINAVAITSPASNKAAAEKERMSYLTPIVSRKKMESKVKKHLIATLEQNQKDLEIPVPLIQAGGPSPVPLPLSSSPTADSFGIQNRRQDPESVSDSVSTLAARLCDSLQFPFLRKENLVSESKEVLLKSLQERHGPWLQDNLLQLRECQDLGVESTKAAQDPDPDPDPVMLEDDDLFPADTFPKMTQRRHLNSKHSSGLYQSQPQTAEWLMTPVDTSVSVLDEIIRPSASSPFCMDFEPFRDSVSDSFASFPTSRHDNKVSRLTHWQDTFSRSNGKESLLFDSFDSSFMKHPKAFKEQRCRPKAGGSRRQPPFPFQAQVPDRYSVEPRRFPQERDPFGAVTCSSSNISAPLYHPSESSQFPTVNKFYLPSTCPPQRSHHTDMMHFPPSHMLERGSATPSSSFPSPEQWSFPPMRLY